MTRAKGQSETVSIPGIMIDGCEVVLIPPLHFPFVTKFEPQRLGSFVLSTVFIFIGSRTIHGGFLFVDIFVLHGGRSNQETLMDATCPCTAISIFEILDLLWGERPTGGMYV